MCGIVGYIGTKTALPILIQGLKALEYRGYDSAGVAVFLKNKKNCKKTLGQVHVLEESTTIQDFDGCMGIAHTRWATHGVPSEANAHPHFDCHERIFLVHNGIIENYKELRKYLEDREHDFVSDTDTEAVAHLIEDFMNSGKSFKDAMFRALKMIRGAYALVIVDSEDPDTVYATRISSPLVIGIGKNENYIASDPSAIIGATKDVIYLKDGEVAEITKTKIKIIDLDKKPKPIEVVRLEWNLEQAKKGDFSHFMLKEIFEGPEVVRSALRGRLNAKKNTVKLGGLEEIMPKIKNMKRLIITACGTSYYAGLIGEYLFEEIAKIPTEVQFASEFRYRKEPFNKNTVALAISQSGETADTLAALTKAKKEKLITLGIVNTVGSSISRATDAGVYNHAGPEIAVASTKAFLSQVTILTLIASLFCKTKNGEFKKILKELEKIPSKIEEILKRHKEIEKLAEKCKNYDDFLFLGRRYNYPTALEGALKLKEISYIHAEGFGAGEMKHGPIALISPNFPTLAIAPKNSVSEKMLSNLEEIKARSGPIFVIATEGDKRFESFADDIFYIPKTYEALEPLLTVVPLQLFAYYIGIKRGCNVDKPRNLAKSVTVE